MEFKKYGKVYRLGMQETEGVLEGDVIIQEKIDGGNFRFYFTNEGQIIFGSRNLNLSENEHELQGHNFKKVIDYILKQIESVEVNTQSLSNFIFYGEACIKHTINYDWDNMPLFLGFDVYNTSSEKYCNLKESEEFFSCLNLQMVPVLDKTSVSVDELNDDLVPISKYASPSAKDQKAEGIVIKNYDKQIFAKYVRDEFKERNAEAFGGQPKYNKEDDTNNSEFMFKYCTNPRIEKVIMKLLDEGKYLDMKLMGDVIRNTYLDIIEEEWREILTSKWKLDFQNLRKKIAPRCRNVLEQMITNNAR